MSFVVSIYYEAKIKKLLSEFVGITSWKYFIKETWREGASISDEVHSTT